MLPSRTGRQRNKDNSFPENISLATQREITILNDPWLHEDGTEIRQRFGRPPIFDETGDFIGQHSFGISPLDNDDFRQVHNVFLTQYPDGTDTITSVWNIQGDDGFSKVFEFVVDLQPSRRRMSRKMLSSSSADEFDFSFPTTFTLTVLGFQVFFQGGACPLSRGSLYVMSSGQSNFLATATPFDGLQLVDSAGGTQNHFYDGPLAPTPSGLTRNVHPIFDAHTVVVLTGPGELGSSEITSAIGSSSASSDSSSRRMLRRLAL